MTLLAADGFDIYDDITDLTGANTGWSISSNRHTISTTGGRYGGGAVQINGSPLTSSYLLRAIPTPVAQGTALYVSFAYKHGTPGTTNSYMAYFVNSGGTYIGSVYMNSDSTVSIRNVSDTVVAGGTSTFAFNTGVWYWVEIKFISALSSAGSIEVRVNGSVIVTSSAMTTASGGGTTVNTFRIFSIANGTAAYIDDLIVNNASGSVNNGYPGDCRIDTVRPTADSGTVDWTSSSGTSHNDVDDPNGASDGDSSYISSNTVSQVSRFTNGALSGSSSSILGVVMRSKAKKTDAGARTYNNEMKSSSTTADATAFDPGTTYAWSPGAGDNLKELDPNGNIAWADAAVNALETGVKLAA